MEEKIIYKDTGGGVFAFLILLFVFALAPYNLILSYGVVFLILYYLLLLIIFIYCLNLPCGYVIYDDRIEIYERITKKIRYVVFINDIVSSKYFDTCGSKYPMYYIYIDYNFENKIKRISLSVTDGDLMDRESNTTVNIIKIVKHLNSKGVYVFGAEFYIEQNVNEIIYPKINHKLWTI